MKEGNVLKSDLFRKNIFTIAGFVFFILILFVILTINSKQSSIKESLNKLNKENTQLKQENKKFKTEQSFYRDKYNNEINTLKAENNGNKETIIKYQNTFEHLQVEIKNNLVKPLSIFSPEYIKKGDKIAGLTVSDFYSKENVNGSKNYKIDFAGEFTVKGTIVPNKIGEGFGFAFMIDKNLEKLPHTLQEYEGVYFTIKNGEDLIKALGEKLKITPFNKLEIEAVFKNYTYNYVPETDIHNAAEFVSLISHN
ncbi:MAG: hypothetical protein K0R18_1717 [Bacillales bacterium]|jgi:hypothetical protein|nr:hypothetical protein [Bacillales bacterium]